MKKRSERISENAMQKRRKTGPEPQRAALIRPRSDPIQDLAAQNMFSVEGRLHTRNVSIDIWRSRGAGSGVASSVRRSRAYSSSDTFSIFHSQFPNFPLSKNQ